MKILQKWLIAIAMILSIGITHTANAVIELRSGSKGDALLFPIFAGQFENYFTIMNDVRDTSPVDSATNKNNHWIQGHLRIWGSVWSSELFDTDIILSPNDVFVFRIADVDGDGYWEIDQSLDPKNFQYTNTLTNCSPEGTIPDTDPSDGISPPTQLNCIDFNATALIPKNTELAALMPGVTTDYLESLIERHKQWGYVEFIAEGILEGMTHEIMEGKKMIDPVTGLEIDDPNTGLIKPANQGKLATQGQKRLIVIPDQAGNLRNYGGLGTHLWSWTNAGGMNGVDRGASDVDNVLSGTAFIAMFPGSSYALAYNAEALYNFRTNLNPHRIDNYKAGLQGVILHDENVGDRSGVSPVGDYVYGYPFNAAGGGTNDDRLEEAQLSFSVTWGPTLADGDDYNPIPTEPGVSVPNVVQDVWDATLAHTNAVALKGPDNINSITEVEEAIRLYGQRYSSFFFDGEINNLTSGTPAFQVFNPICQGNGCSANTLMSWYQIFLPTKHFYGVSLPLPPKFMDYLNQTVSKLLANSPSNPKLVGVDVWDIEERSACECPCEKGGEIEGTIPLCSISPCARPIDEKEWFKISCRLEGCSYWIPFESTTFNIDDVKKAILNNIQFALKVEHSSNPSQKLQEMLEKAKAECEADIGKQKSFVDSIAYGKFALWPHVDNPALPPLPLPVQGKFNDPGKLVGGLGNPPDIAALPFLAYTFELKWPMVLSPEIPLGYHWRQMQR
jgi:hypothetical protein